jgi:hypothetical protein
MRRFIKYEPDYQQIAILFNADADIVVVASLINKLSHTQLVYTGDLCSYDEDLGKELNFHAFSYNDESSKTTMFLIKNKTEFINENSPIDLFSDQKMVVQRHLMGAKNSVYKMKPLYNSDYCFILSFPKCQSKPELLINRLKSAKELIAARLVVFEDFNALSDLTQEIELYIVDYNKRNSHSQLASKRRDVLFVNNQAVAEPINNAQRIIFSDL